MNLDVKRAFDLIVGSVLLLAFSPVMLVVAALIRMRMGPPVLFRQRRPGLAGKPFTVLKFRTMAVERDESRHALGDAQRLTPLGRTLRRYSLDELPQLINVVGGTMSLVGPRPLLMEYLDLYTEHQFRRHEVPPGITGWAQVNGRNELSWEQKFELDLWYVDHKSFLLDLRILGLTLLHVLRPRGVTQEGHATVERFRGTKAGNGT